MQCLADVCRHADEVAQASLCMIRAGHAEAVSKIKAALVDSGGLALACEAQNALLALDDMAASETCQQLVRWAVLSLHVIISPEACKFPFLGC